MSGRGSNLLALCEALADSSAAAVVLVVSERNAPALELAQARGIATHILADHRDPAEWQRVLKAAGIELVVLAGYLKLVPAELVESWSGRIINIHPALLPRHGGPGMYGSRVHQAVLAAGDRESGATVHLVEAAYDRGAILAQGRVEVLPGDTPEELAQRVLEVEHRLLPAVVLATAKAGRPVPVSFP